MIPFLSPFVQKALANRVPDIQPAGDANVVTQVTTATLGNFADIVRLVLIVGATAFAGVFVVWGGLQYIMAAGDQEKAKKGKTTVINAVIGMAIVVGVNGILDIADLLGNALTDITGGNSTGPLRTFLTSIGGNFLDLLLTATGIAAVFYVVYAGLQYIMAAGSPEKQKTARTTLVNAITGIVIFAGVDGIIRFARMLGGVVRSTGNDTSALSHFITTAGHNAVGIITLIANLAVGAYIIYAGVQYIMAAGSPEKQKSAKTSLINAMIGLVIVVGVDGFVSVGNLLGDTVVGASHNNAPDQLTGLIRSLGTNVKNLLILIADVTSLIYVIYSGIQYIISAGNPEKQKTARNSLTNALIGVIIVIGVNGFISLSTLLGHAVAGVTNNNSGNGLTAVRAFIRSFGNKFIMSILLIAGTLAVIYIIYSGIQYIISVGNPEKQKAAKNSLINAVIGIIIIAATYGIVKLTVNIGASIGRGLSQSTVAPTQTVNRGRTTQGRIGHRPAPRITTTRHLDNGAEFASFDSGTITLMPSDTPGSLGPVEVTNSTNGITYRLDPDPDPTSNDLVETMTTSSGSSVGTPTALNGVAGDLTTCLRGSHILQCIIQKIFNQGYAGTNTPPRRTGGTTSNDTNRAIIEVHAGDHFQVLSPGSFKFVDGGSYIIPVAGGDPIIHTVDPGATENLGVGIEAFGGSPHQTSSIAGSPPCTAESGINIDPRGVIHLDQTQSCYIEELEGHRQVQLPSSGGRVTYPDGSAGPVFTNSQIISAIYHETITGNRYTPKSIDDTNNDSDTVITIGPGEETTVPSGGDTYKFPTGATITIPGAGDPIIMDSSEFPIRVAGGAQIVGGQAQTSTTTEGTNDRPQEIGVGASRVPVPDGGGVYYFPDGGYAVIHGSDGDQTLTFDRDAVQRINAGVDVYGLPYAGQAPDPTTVNDGTYPYTGQAPAPDEGYPYLGQDPTIIDEGYEGQAPADNDPFWTAPINPGANINPGIYTA